MNKLFHLLRGIMFRLSAIANILAVRCAYAKTLRDVRQRIKGRKVRVLFPVNEISKWKLQSVYDLMKASGVFDLSIAVTLADVNWRLSSTEQEKLISDLETFFNDRNMPTVKAYDTRKRQVVPFEEFSPDIVFYNQPWGYEGSQMPAAVSIYALTCYVPYFVLNFGEPNIEVLTVFHQQLWRHFLLSRSWADEFGKHCHFWTHAGDLVGLGHPQLDYYHLHAEEFEETNLVIYAPHWSISTDSYDTFENYSTFLHVGRKILEYAKGHLEFRWVFKPHPSLKIALRESGAWTESQIAEYWAEWESFAIGCYTCDYPALFVKSKALITDCASFLPEYFATGKPLIHLISANRKVEPAPAAKQYFDTFYQVHNENELLETLGRVVEKGEDWRRHERLAMLERIGLRGNYAAKNIVDYLKDTLMV